MIAKTIRFEKRLMVQEKKEVKREGKKTMFFLGLIGMAMPKVEMSVDEDFFNMLEEGQEFEGTFTLKETIKDAGYGKFNWSYVPQLEKIDLRNDKKK